MYISWERFFFTTGTGPWHTHASYTLLTKSIFPRVRQTFSRVGSPELIQGSPICIVKSMNVFINLFSITKKVSKYIFKNIGHIIQESCVYIISNFILCFWYVFYAYIMILFYLCLQYVPYASITILVYILIQNTHLEISWKNPSLMNLASFYNPIVRKRTL